MNEPLARDEALLADVSAARAQTENFHLWRLGQSGFLLQWQGRHVLLDPYLSDSLTRKYADTERPHVRITGRVVAPERLDFIDVVSSSHNHTDHFDAETLKPLLKVNPRLRVIVPEANRTFAAQRIGVDPAQLLGLDAGTSTSVAGFHFTGVPAAHETVEQDEAGRCRYLGYIVRFGRWTLYHSGDTIRYDGMVDSLNRWKPDVMLLPINGRDPARGVAGNLEGPEAATLAKECHARIVIPCHYDMFAFNCADPGEFVRAAERLKQPYAVLACGERWSSATLDRV